MKFEFILRKLRLNKLMGLQYEQPWLKGQRSVGTFLIRLNIT